MSAGRERPRTPGGRVDDSDVDVPTDQGPAGEDVTTRIYEEPELPKRDGKPEKSEPRAVAPDPGAGDTVGDYELLEKLGKGGAGAVFRARRKSDGEIVALKVLAAARAKRARIVQRFFDEVRAAREVRHPGLIRVLDFIEEDEPRRLAYAMEFVAGDTLRERLKKEGALDLREAIHIAAEVAGALAALHDAGIIHRDLKPENIMTIPHPGGNGMPKVKLLDFGVVKFLPIDRSGHSPSSDEKKGTFVGTPRYMAPEQAAGGVVDVRADLFAVGVLLYEMITGSCPHEGASLRDVVLAKLKGAPRIKVTAGKEILPAELTDIVDRCLQLKPALRPKSAREVSYALQEAETVLFIIGPVKQDESGSFVRPASQINIPPIEPQHTPLPPPIAETQTTMPETQSPLATPLPLADADPTTPDPLVARRARQLALGALAIAVLSVIIVLVMHFMEDEPTLLVPLDPPKPDLVGTATTATSTRP